jgi:hypothetical protein
VVRDIVRSELLAHTSRVAVSRAVAEIAGA